MRVLVVDPTPFQRRILALLLEARGIPGVESAAHPDELSPADPGDLVFCEASLLVPAIPSGLARGMVIATGTEKADAVLAEAVAAGAAAFLTKPYTEARLGLALADLELRRTPKARRAKMAPRAPGSVRPPEDTHE